jgi:hypothetical protein
MVTAFPMKLNLFCFFDEKKVAKLHGTEGFIVHGGVDHIYIYIS